MALGFSFQGLSLILDARFSIAIARLCLKIHKRSSPGEVCTSVHDFSSFPFVTFFIMLPMRLIQKLAGTG